MKTVISEIVAYIEMHITEKLTPELISKHVGYSQFYINRIFSVYTGMSMMEYTRKRRLSFAAMNLLEGKRIIDIALEYGYNSERSFSRAFSKEYGRSPSQCRKQPVCRQDKLVIYDIHLPEKEGINMLEYLSNVKYETLDEMLVIKGMKVGLEPEDEIIGLFQSFEKTFNIKSIRSFGFDVPIEEDLKEKGQRAYEYWISVSKEDVENIFQNESSIAFMDTQISYQLIPSFRYVTLRITDPFADPLERIPNAWKALVKWIEVNNALKKNPSEDDIFPCLEEVIEVDQITYMDIYMPIGS